jgi:hypothetical protein
VSARTILVALAISALTATAASAAPLSDWAQGQLKEMDASGFGQAAPGLTFEGAVTQGQEGQVTVAIPAAGKYALVGSCGEDCTDIGLILQQGGKTVGEGVTGFRKDLQPGSYGLKIGFDNCKAAQCRYVVRVYRKD